MEHPEIVLEMRQHRALLEEIRDEVRKTNGRVNRHDVVIGRINLALFGGGSIVVLVIGYLAAMHIHP